MEQARKDDVQKQNEYSTVSNIGHKHIFPSVQRAVATAQSVQLICWGLSWVSDYVLNSGPSNTPARLG